MSFLINTVNTKRDQLAKGMFTMGNGPTVIMLVGSCRAVPYLNYFHYLNAGSKFTIHFLDPFNFHYDQHDRIIDLEQSLLRWECDSRILGALKQTKIFIHEFYRHFGFFNCDRTQPKHIYQLGMAPEKDICLPNFHDVFVLFNDFVKFDAAVRKLFTDRSQMGMPVDDALLETVRDKGLANIQRFYDVCSKSAFPDFAGVFDQAWRAKRLFWNNNHVSGLFTSLIFGMLNGRFLGLNAPKEFWQRIAMEDMYSRPCTGMTPFDREAYGLTWNEPTTPLIL